MTQTHTDKKNERIQRSMENTKTNFLKSNVLTCLTKSTGSLTKTGSILILKTYFLTNKLIFLSEKRMKFLNIKSHPENSIINLQ